MHPRRYLHTTPRPVPPWFCAPMVMNADLSENERNGARPRLVRLSHQRLLLTISADSILGRHHRNPLLSTPSLAHRWGIGLRCYLLDHRCHTRHIPWRSSDFRIRRRSTCLASCHAVVLLRFDSVSFILALTIQRQRYTVLSLVVLCPFIGPSCHVNCGHSSYMVYSRVYCSIQLHFESLMRRPLCRHEEGHDVS